MFIRDAGYISDGVYMGSAPCPRIGSVAKWGTEPLDATAIRGAEPNQKDASCLGVPKPHISDGVYLGECPSPEVYMGSTPCPKDRTLLLFGRMPEPQSEGRKLFGSPQAP